MPIQGYTPNRSLTKISSGSTDNWDVWMNSNMDALDDPSLLYRITAGENISQGYVAVIKDDGFGAKKAYLGASGAYTFGDPVGIVTQTVSAGGQVSLILAGRAYNPAWSFGPLDKFVYLSASGAVTTTQVGDPIGYVLSSSTIYFGPGASAGAGGSGSMGAQDANAVAITGGSISGTTIDGSAIGGTTPASAQFTTVGVPLASGAIFFGTAPPDQSRIFTDSSGPLRSLNLVAGWDEGGHKIRLGLGDYAGGWAGMAVLTPSGMYLGGDMNPVNMFDVSGSAVIGAAYAGNNSAPANGLLVEGNVAVGTSALTAGAALEVSSTAGALLVPRMTTAQRDAITGVNGMIIYNTTLNQMQGFINGAWTLM